MTLSHSTQRPMPALCSSSVTQMEIMRVCAQARGGLVEEDRSARPDCSKFMVHLQGSRANEYHCLYVSTINNVSLDFTHVA